MDTLAEIRQLRTDLLALGDHSTAALLEKAEQRFLAWEFDKGYGWLQRALEERQRNEAADTATEGAARYFASCALAVG